MTSETKVILITSDEDTIRQVKPNKTRKKSTDLICTICADRAIGYNYAVLSCASCKAFFHRTGHEDSVCSLISHFRFDLMWIFP